MPAKRSKTIQIVSILATVVGYRWFAVEEILTKPFAHSSQAFAVMFLCDDSLQVGYSVLHVLNLLLSDELLDQRCYGLIRFE